MRSLMAVCRSRGVYVRRRNVAGARPFAGRDGKERWVKLGAKGQSDLWGIMPAGCRNPGRHLEIEVKRPGEAPAAAQIDYLRSIESAGGLALWCDDIDWFMQVIDHLIAGAATRLTPDGQVHLYYRERSGR